MAEIVIRIDGLDKILKNLSKAPEIIKREGSEAIEKTIYIIQATSIPLTPIRTGNLRRSYSSRFRPLQGILKVSAQYAGFVHEGTRFQRSQPFLRQGIDKSQPRINNIWRELGINIAKDLAK